ncbi:MAG: GTPase-associated system all-helical protein GASH [Phycisphaerales bacterium]
MPYDGYSSELEKSTKKAVQALATGWNPDAATMRQHLDSFGSQLVDVFTTLSANLSAGIRYQREEMDVLWWLFGAISRDQHLTFKSLGARALPLVAAKELADLTIILPGLPSSTAFLRRVLENAGDAETLTTPADCVNSTDAEWRAKWIVPQPATLEDLTPLIAAMRLSLQNPQWPTALQGRFGFDPSEPWTAIELSRQLYAELLMNREYAQPKR